MVEIINDTNDRSWLYKIGIKDHIAENILSHLPICRLREIGRIKGVGEQAYSGIFRSLYEQADKIRSLPDKTNMNQDRQLGFKFDTTL